MMNSTLQFLMMNLTLLLYDDLDCTTVDDELDYTTVDDELTINEEIISFVTSWDWKLAILIGPPFSTLFSPENRK